MKQSRIGMILGVVALLFLATGCSSLVGGKWAVKVNGDPVLVSDYNNRIAAAQKLYEQQGMDFTTDQGKKDLSQLKNQILDRMVEGKLIAQDVKKLNLNPEDASVKTQEDSIKNNLGSQTKFQDTLNQQGMTEQELKNFLAVYGKVTSGVKVSDADVKTFFDKNSANYGQPESVTAHHILVKTEAEAQAIITQLNAAEKNKTPILPLFEQIAKDKSIEPGAKDSGGSLGTFTRGQMVPEFENAAFAQKVGTFSTTPVKSQFGYHVIYIDAHTPAVAPDFTKVKAKVEQDALNQAKDAKFQTYFDDLRKKATIEYAKGYQPAS